MEEAQKRAYKYCIVPKCKNTVISVPDKVFFSMPSGSEIRKQWCRVMKRSGTVSPISSLYCCEDHFNIEEDTENYVRYNIMKQEGVKVTLRLKKGVLPHIFHCQKRNMPRPVIRMGAVKRQQLALIKEALSESAVKSDVLKISKRPQTNYIKEMKSSDNENKLHSDKATQVNIKTKRKQIVALSPVKFPLSLKNTTTSSALTSGSEIKLFADNPDDTSTFSVISPDYEQSCSSVSSWIPEDYSENEKHFQDQMPSVVLIAIENEPEMILGLP